MESCTRVSGGRSFSQSKCEVVTTDFGTPQASSCSSHREILGGVAQFVSEDRRVPVEAAGEGLGVRIDQQLRGIEALAALGIVRAVNAIAVQLAELDAGQVAVPDIAGAFANGDDFGFLGIDFVEQAQFDGGGLFGIEGKIDSGAIPSGALRVWFTGQYGSRHRCGRLSTPQRSKPWACRCEVVHVYTIG